MTDNDNLKRFTDGVTLNGKLFGVETVKKETGDDVCQEAMIKLKAIIAVSKEHKKKLIIRINLEGIELVELESGEILYKHSVNRISYIARDLKDARAIGYIYKNTDNTTEYFGLRTEKPAQEMFNLLKDLFETVLEMRKSPGTKVTTEPKITDKSEEVNSSDKAPLIPDEPEVNEPAVAPPPEKKPVTVPVVEPEQKQAPVPVEEPSLFDLSSDVPAPAQPAPSAMDDLFGLSDLSLESPPVTTPQPTSSMGNNDLFSLLNASPAPAVTQAQFTNQFSMPLGDPNMMGMGNMSAQFSPLITQSNPFGLINQVQPRAAPIPPPAAPAPVAAPKVTDAFDDLFN